MLYELAALGAALCWAIAALLAADVTRAIGGVAFTRLRVLIGFALLLLITLFSGALQSVAWQHYPLLMLSGIIGLALGDGALFITFKRLGPRRAQVLYASNAPMAVLLGVLFLGERPGTSTILGIVAVVSGVIIAIIWGKRRDQLHRWETVQGSVLVGVLFGLLSGFGQALGSLLVKPVLEQGVNPMAASAIRLGAAAGLLLLLSATPRARQTAQPMTRRHLVFTTANSVLSLVVGVSLLLYAFSQGDIGVASVLSSTMPVLVLPLLWLKTAERPALAAWFGAMLTVLGSAMIIYV